MRPARLVLLLFLVAQLWDGVFTYAAVHAYGIEAEGNQIISTWMILVGPAPTILVAKILASACGLLLYIKGVHRTLALLTLIYAAAAIGPWLVIFHGLR